MLPQFSITGTLGGNADQIPWLFRYGRPVLDDVGGVTQPVFEGGTLLHNKRAAEGRVETGRGSISKHGDCRLPERRRYAARVALRCRALAGAVEAENAAKVTYDLTRRQMEAGYVSYLALLSAETAYNQALLTRVQAQATRYGDTIALFQALGGGWWNRKEVAAR
jgi:outer membrane protein TolC